MEDKKINEKKSREYLRFDEACEYYGVGKATMRNWIEESGARRKVGSIVLINVRKMNEYIEMFADEPAGI